MKLLIFWFVVFWVIEFIIESMLKGLRQKIKGAIEKKVVRSIVNYQLKEVRNMKANTSWKTTLTGLLTALVPFMSALIDAYNSGQFTGKDGIGLALAVGIFLQGYFAKDKDVTGLPAAPKGAPVVPDAGVNPEETVKGRKPGI